MAGNINSLGISNFFLKNGKLYIKTSNGTIPVSEVEKTHKIKQVDSGDYKITETDELVVINSPIAVTVTLPEPNEGQNVIIKNIGIGIVTVIGYEGETIEGANTQPLFTDEAFTLFAYSRNWYLN